MAVLTDTERRLRRTPLYNEIDLPHRFVWYSRQHDTFTLDGRTHTRRGFIERWGIPGTAMDVIAWDPYE